MTIVTGVAETSSSMMTIGSVFVPVPETPTMRKPSKFVRETVGAGFPAFWPQAFPGQPLATPAKRQQERRLNGRANRRAARKRQAPRYGPENLGMPHGRSMDEKRAARTLEKARDLDQTARGLA